MGTLIIMFQRICFVEMAANQYKVTTGYKIIPQISHPRKIFLNIYGQKRIWKLWSFSFHSDSQQKCLLTSYRPASTWTRKHCSQHHWFTQVLSFSGNYYMNISDHRVDPKYHGCGYLLVQRVQCYSYALLSRSLNFQIKQYITKESIYKEISRE